MQIKQIKIKDSGFKGLEISRYENYTKNKINHIKEVIDKPKDPIHGDLRNLINDLRVHLLDICGHVHDKMEDMEIKYAVGDSEVTLIKIEKNSFVIGGEKKTDYNNKYIKLETPKIDAEDEYHGFKEVMDIIENIVKETELYMNGSKVISNEEVVKQYLMAGKDKKISIEQFEAMSEDEQKEFYRDKCEELGMFVTDPATDLEEIKEDEMEEVVIELPKSKNLKTA